MKKVLFIFLFVLFTFSSFAQLNVTSSISDENKPKTVLILQPTYSELVKFTYGYVFCASTDNRFDKGGTSLYIGDSIESSLKTLYDLEDFLSKKTRFIKVQQFDGPVELLYDSQLGIKMYWIKNYDNAGKSWISLPQIKKMIKYFEKLSQNEECKENISEDD